MRKHTCGQCGGPLSRVHRTFLQRLFYRSVYLCQECAAREFTARVSIARGENCHCPRCGTERLNRLRRPDHIDRMQGGIRNTVERLRGGKLYHCGLCRLQFYDRRPFKTQNAEPSAAGAGMASLERNQAGRPG